VNEGEPQMTGGEFGRWLVLGTVILLGIGLFFAFARRTNPVIHPPAVEEGVP